MILIQGQGVSGGVVKGPLYFIRRAAAEIPAAGKSPEIERERFFAAQQQCIRQLTALARRIRETAGEEAALLFEAHAMLAEDEDFVSAILESIGGGASAEHAAQTAGEQFAGLLSAMDYP